MEQAIALSMATAAAEAGTRGLAADQVPHGEEREGAGFTGHHISPDPLADRRAGLAAKRSFQMRTYANAVRHSTVGLYGDSEVRASPGRCRRWNGRRESILGRSDGRGMDIQSRRMEEGEGPIAWATTDEEDQAEPQTPVMIETSAPSDHQPLLTPQRGAWGKRSRRNDDGQTECTTAPAGAPSPELCPAAIEACSQASTERQPVMTGDHVTNLPMLRSFSVSQKARGITCHVNLRPTSSYLLF